MELDDVAAAKAGLVGHHSPFAKPIHQHLYEGPQPTAGSAARPRMQTGLLARAQRRLSLASRLISHLGYYEASRAHLVPHQPTLVVLDHERRRGDGENSHMVVWNHAAHAIFLHFNPRSDFLARMVGRG